LNHQKELQINPYFTAEPFGTKGPLTVESEFAPISSPWFAAGRQLGFPTEDPNTIEQGESKLSLYFIVDHQRLFLKVVVFYFHYLTGFTPMHKLISRGQRVSTYTAYIKPHEGKRQNLTVVRYAYANEVLIDEVSKKAYGVAYTRHGIFPQVAHASREIIISCGTFLSPLLLMRSGIGPADVLEKPGVGSNY